MKRAEPCHCGSGLPYEECHGKEAVIETSSTVDAALYCNLPKEIQDKIINWEKRKKEQGAVRDMISLDFQGAKVVAVGSQLVFSKKCKTFHDFLFGYIKDSVGFRLGQLRAQQTIRRTTYYSSVVQFIV
jgi:hypothetical protein